MPIANFLKKLMLTRTFSVEKGRIRLFNKVDFIMYHARSLAINFQSVGEKLGEEFLFKMGFESGLDCGDDYIESMKIEKKNWFTIQQIMQLTEFLGVGEVKVIKKDYSDSGHDVVIRIYNNPAIEYGHKLYAKKSMVCAWFRGVFTGHVRREMGIKDFHLDEVKCFRDGNSYCEWASKS